MIHSGEQGPCQVFQTQRGLKQGINAFKQLTRLEGAPEKSGSPLTVHVTSAVTAVRKPVLLCAGEVSAGNAAL